MSGTSGLVAPVGADSLVEGRLGAGRARYGLTLEFSSAAPSRGPATSSLSESQGGSPATVWAIAAITSALISAAVMLLYINAYSLTGDEGFTGQMVRLPWRQMLGDLASIDYNMALHYLLLKAWTGVAGDSEVALRLPSVMLAVSTLYLTFRLVRRLFDVRVASLTVILLSFNPFFLMVGLEARPFAFLMAWSVLATTLLMRALEAPSRRNWIVYGLIGVVGLHIQLLSALVIGGHALYAVASQRRVTPPNLLAAALILGLGVTPTALFLAPADTLSWVGPFHAARALRVVIDVAGGGVIGGLTLVLAAIGLVKAPRVRFSWLVRAWLLIPVLVFLALAPFQSLFVKSYFAGLLPPLALLAALGLSTVTSRFSNWAKLAALPIGALALVATAAQGGLATGADWRGLVASLQSHIEAGEGVAFPNPFYRIVNEYYSIKSADGPFPLAEPALPNDPWGTLSPYQLDFIKRTGIQADHDVFEPDILAWGRIWVIGIGDEFDRAVIADLVSHGYGRAGTIEAGSARAVLFTNR